LIFAQLNSPDSVAHVHGPDAEEALESYRALDSSLGLIGSATRWDQDLVLVTSDHDQETVDPCARIDRDRGLDVTIVDQGTAAMLTGPDAVRPTWIEGIQGIAGWDQVAPDIVVVFSTPGWWFAERHVPDLRGAHGEPRTRATVAVAAGAEALLSPIASRIADAQLGAEDWFDLVQTARSIRLMVQSGSSLRRCP